MIIICLGERCISKCKSLNKTVNNHTFCSDLVKYVTVNNVNVVKVVIPGK